MAGAAPVVKFEAGSWCWIPHEEHMFLPAKVTKTTFKKGDPGEVILEDGKVSVIPTKGTGNGCVCALYPVFPYYIFGCVALFYPPNAFPHSYTDHCTIDFQEFPFNIPNGP